MFCFTLEIGKRSIFSIAAATLLYWAFRYFFAVLLSSAVIILQMDFNSKVYDNNCLWLL
ncbi:hypothetical protein KFK09_011297 [Dendrobium nobile]|uniref:Uncharacterized protein n=1 Tax=Dendrobium nobile TaxID=94219 RepID=A0A8T3BHV9_DENNO|nr:hypothetical protein KFK09_011297 [Dendrobium nobile]